MIGWLKMNRIVSIIPESSLSNFSGKTAGDNANNIWFLILNSCQEINQTQRLLSIPWRKLNCFQDNKGVYCWCPTSATMALKPIQIPYAPIKPQKSLAYHQVVSCTLSHARCNRTTEFCNSPIFQPNETIIDINWCFARILLKDDRSNNGTAGSTFVLGLTH